MDASELERFVGAQWAGLQEARVARVVCVSSGIVFELQAENVRRELALLTLPGSARAFVFDADARARVHLDFERIDPSWIAPLDARPPRWPDEATTLDALRAWLLRPAAQPPEWLQLENAHLRALRCQPDDRRLWIEFERRDSVGRDESFVLLAELFDRGGNFILRSDSGDELANWKQRRPAPERNARSASDAADAAPATPQTSPGASEPAASLAHLAPAAAHELAAAHRRGRRRHERRARAKVKKLEEDARRAELAHTLRRMAEALMANLHQVRRGASHVTLDDLYAPGNALDIDLDPRLSPQENAAALFKRARRGDRGRETTASRLEEARRELDAIAARTEDNAEPLDWPSALAYAYTTWLTSLSEALARADMRTLWAPGGPRWERPTPRDDSPRRTPRDVHPGRVFTLPGDWEVRVGRNNAENDELTHAFAHPNDVWLHASGVPGSHVVLRMHGKRDNPPRDVLEAAAAIAARFSRAKHARTVPVIWTRKRYVRKPRKSPPGQAVCTHEKTVFVQPGLPAGEDDGDSGTENR